MKAFVTPDGLGTGLNVNPARPVNIPKEKTPCATSVPSGIILHRKAAPAAPAVRLDLRHRKKVLPVPCNATSAASDILGPQVKENASRNVRTVCFGTDRPVNFARPEPIPEA